MENDTSQVFIQTVSRVAFLVLVITVCIAGTLVLVSIKWNVSDEYFAKEKDISAGSSPKNNAVASGLEQDRMWLPPDTTVLREMPDEGALIDYGKKLISNTSYFLGPKGTVAKMSNGMSCQNCHLEAGTKIFGNNYSAVASTYPKFRARSGTQETIEKRVNDCFERSLNGRPLQDDSKEMNAIVAYIGWLGKDVLKGVSPKGSGLGEIEYLDRAANPEKGEILYAAKCSACHGKLGEGVLKASGESYTYPPLWGKKSYNVGAGLYRLSNFARFVKLNMPLGTNYTAPTLTDEECWDIAAFVNSRPRPAMDISKDWPDISKKPFDHPFGPYEDSFTELQHKFGPFKIIIKNKK